MDDKPSGVTGRQMCEHIVKASILEKPDGSSPTAEEIWNYSSSGELYWVFEWYRLACSIIGPIQKT